MSFGFRKKISAPIPIPKPNFGLTLLESLGHFKGSTKKKWL